MKLRGFLSLCGIGICVVFGLYMFGFIQPNKENLDFLVEKQPKTEKNNQVHHQIYLQIQQIQQIQQIHKENN
ncbi:hypothetical protein [Candidatus Phytoplasma sp. AldY-WA1]|uniref:hypothetical protein n=1 Tax=Candidatus Phytoplasma sp. AldY-WA1 TaxID=2852100 RepID=UPI00254FE76E|nr:hypothetical protein [Candidatus Phytoplasma sp. AldY-WA1]